MQTFEVIDVKPGLTGLSVLVLEYQEPTGTSHLFERSALSSVRTVKLLGNTYHMPFGIDTIVEGEEAELLVSPVDGTEGDHHGGNDDRQGEGQDIHPVTGHGDGGDNEGEHGVQRHEDEKVYVRLHRAEINSRLQPGAEVIVHREAHISVDTMIYPVRQPVRALAPAEALTRAAI